MYFSLHVYFGHFYIFSEFSNFDFETNLMEFDISEFPRTSHDLSIIVLLVYYYNLSAYTTFDVDGM